MHDHTPKCSSSLAYFICFSIKAYYECSVSEDGSEEDEPPKKKSKATKQNQKEEDSDEESGSEDSDSEEESGSEAEDEDSEDDEAEDGSERESTEESEVWPPNMLHAGARPIGMWTHPCARGPDPWLLKELHCLLDAL